MIKSLLIKHFKTIKNLKIDFSKVNLFIGEPNTGKSNLIESLSIFSWLGHRQDNEFTDFVRIKDYSDLFYDNLTSDEIDVQICLFKNNQKSETDCFEGYKLFLEDDKYTLKTSDDTAKYNLTGGGGTSSNNGVNQYSKSIKYYKYNQDTKIEIKPGNILFPPYGKNLFSVVNSNKYYRKLVSEIFKGFNLTMVLRRLGAGGVILELQKTVGDYVIHLPYEILSDTIKNLVFHYLAIDSNKNSVLLLEEPEVHTFPLYTSELAEKISIDESNQFLIVTHNQAFFNSIVLKTPSDNLSVFGFYLKDGKTIVKKLKGMDLEEMVETDPFLNLKKYL